MARSGTDPKDFVGSSFMELKNKVAVITGGASGIGAALVQRFHEEGARAIVVADRDGQGAAEVAAAVGGTGVACDVADESAIKALVADTVAHHGALDFVCVQRWLCNGGRPRSRRCRDVAYV